MTAEAANIQPPEHPTHALATYELSRYRRELEHALNTLPGHAAVRTPLQQRLTDVLTEQQARAQLRQTGATGA